MDKSIYDAGRAQGGNAAVKEPLWQVKDVINYGEQAIINGNAQFGFHDHAGGSYLVDYSKNYIGLLSGDGAVWTAGESDPKIAPVHYTVPLIRPKYIARAFCHNALLIAEEDAIYLMDLENYCFKPLIEKGKAGIVDIGNCVPDQRDDIWVNDVKGCRVFHFRYDGSLVETIGSGKPGFQQGTVPFEEASFNWMYDLRLGPDGCLYVLDSKNFAVRKIDAIQKTVATVCGDGTGGYTGDGGDAGCARLGNNATEYFDGPWSLFVDEENHIIIGDTQNHAIRFINAATNVITTIARAEDRAPNGKAARFEKICGMDYHRGMLYIPDWRKDAKRTSIILQRREYGRDIEERK